MKLGIQLLSRDSTLNRIQVMPNVKINQGESLNLVFQLIDLDQKGLRFVPSSSATALVEISRFPDVFGSAGNQRVTTDFSIRRPAAMLFPSDDRSLWYTPLSAADTSQIMSSNVRVTVTDGADTYITLLSMALVVTRSEIVPLPA